MVHPATLLWWRQRELCHRCAHLRLTEGARSEGIMTCRAQHNEPYCIDQRLPGSACGPSGAMFKELKRDPH